MVIGFLRFEDRRCGGSSVGSSSKGREGEADSDREPGISPQ
jgi:hypothetical protein